MSRPRRAGTVCSFCGQGVVEALTCSKCLGAGCRYCTGTGNGDEHCNFCGLAPIEPGGASGPEAP